MKRGQEDLGGQSLDPKSLLYPPEVSPTKTNKQTNNPQWWALEGSGRGQEVAQSEWRIAKTTVRVEERGLCSHQAMDVLPGNLVPSGVAPPLSPQSLTQQGKDLLFGVVVSDISGCDPDRPGQVPWKGTKPCPITRRGSGPFHLLREHTITPGG